MKILTSDSDEEEKPVKKSTKAVEPLPNVPPPLRCDFYDSVPSYSHSNKSQKKKLEIKVNLHKSRKIQQTSIPSGVKGKALLVQNVLDARKRTTEQCQKKLSSQSLSSNKVIKATNSLKKQSQEHQIELMQMQTERSKSNKQTLSENNEVTEENNNILQQSENPRQPLSNIENKLDFEGSVDFMKNTEDSVANYTAIKKHIHVDIPSKAASNFEHMELPQFYSNIEESQTSSSTTSERNIIMRGIYHIAHLLPLCHELETIRFTYLIC